MCIYIQSIYVCVFMKAYSHIAAAILKDFFKFEPVISTVPVQGRFPVDVRSVPRAKQEIFSHQKLHYLPRSHSFCQTYRPTDLDGRL